MCQEKGLTAVRPFSCCLMVQFGAQFEACILSPCHHFAPQGLGVFPPHDRTKPNRNVHVPCAKMMERVRNEPCLVHPGNVGVPVLESDWHNGKAFFRTGVEHPRTVFEQIGSSESCPFRKNHHSHSFRQPLTDRRSGLTSAVLAVSVDPNRPKERGSPTDDGPRFCFPPSYVNDRKLNGKQDGIYIGSVIAHHHSWFIGRLSFVLNADAHDDLHPSDKGQEMLVNQPADVVRGRIAHAMEGEGRRQH